MFRQYKFGDYRFRLILWVVSLSVLGILIIGSARESFQQKQIFGLALGVFLMLFISMIDYTWVLNFYGVIYMVSIVLLLAVLFVGTNVNGATRWVEIAGLRFQPSDISKIMIILFFSAFFEKHQDDLNHVTTILKAVVLIGIQLLLIFREPDLSTTIVVALLFSAMYFSAGLSYRIIGGILLVFIPVAVIGISVLMRPGTEMLENYQLTRIYAWLKPDEYPQDAYQQQNSITAIGSGQLYGKGLNNENVESVKNGGFIPEPQTDFIFAVAGEELGFIGCCAIVLLEFLIALECLLTGMRSRMLSGTLICCGMASLVFFQSSLSISVTTGLLPNTGITLPFVSYGLTSLDSFCIGIGFVLNVGLQSKKY